MSGRSLVAENAMWMASAVAAPTTATVVDAAPPASPLVIDRGDDGGRYCSSLKWKLQTPSCIVRAGRDVSRTRRGGRRLRWRPPSRASELMAPCSSRPSFVASSSSRASSRASSRRVGYSHGCAARNANRSMRRRGADPARSPLRRRRPVIVVASEGVPGQ
jgi:hypothetical protein